MKGNITFHRGYEYLDFYRNSSLEQKAIIKFIISHIQYAEKEMEYDGKDIIIQKGQLWISSGYVLKQMIYFHPKSDFKASDYRYAVKKLVDKGYLSVVKKSRNSGSIYTANDKIYKHFLVVFKSKNVTNEQQTNNKQTTNERQTNNKRNMFKTNELERIETNEQQTKNTRKTFAKHPNNNNRNIDINTNINTNRSNGGNTIHHKKNPQTTPFKKSEKKSEDLKRKKVAAKKEKEFEFPPAPEVGDPIDLYFDSERNFTYWQERYPKLDIRVEFKKIKEALFRKSGKGNHQKGNFYGYVLKVLNNREMERKQAAKGQFLNQNQNSTNYGNRQLTKAKVSDWSDVRKEDLKHGILANW